MYSCRGLHWDKFANLRDKEEATENIPRKYEIHQSLIEININWKTLLPLNFLFTKTLRLTIIPGQILSQTYLNNMFIVYTLTFLQTVLYKEDKIENDKANKLEG